MKKILVVILSLLLLAGFAGCGGSGTTDTATTDQPATSEAATTDGSATPIVMGISSGSSGTSWRDIMIESIKTLGDEMKASGVIKDYKVVNNVTNGDATEQANIIRDFIADPEINVIVINPNSPDALNGVIKEAQDAGKLVLSADATVTAPNVVNVTLDHYAWNKKNVEFIASTLKSGNVIQVYGLDGHPANNERIKATEDVLKNYPDIKMVASSTGGWDQQQAKEVTTQMLGGGQQIDGVITQDGMAFGCLSAFQDAGKLPKVMFGDPGTAFFKEWNKLREEKADFKACAQPNPPGIMATGMKIAVRLFNGKTLKDGVLKDGVYYYQVSSFFTDENFDEAWAMLKDKPDDYLLSEVMADADVDALFN